MFRNLRPTFAAALVLSVVVPSLASAESYHYRSQGESAYAGFFEADATGCVWTYTDIYASAGRSRTGPGPASEPSTWVDLYLYEIDYCQSIYTTQIYASTVIPADAFRSQGGLQSAVLQTTIQAYNWATGATVPVSIDLTWTGEGEIFRGHNSNHGTYPGVRYNSRSMGSSRSATVAGSITLQPKVLSMANAYGNLATNQSAYTTIVHNRPN